MKPLGDDGFDPIVPRNVLIYFDSKSKSAAMHNVGAALKPDGFLMTGGAEGGAEFLKDYRRIEPRLYGKPGR